ncbi:ATP-binding protein [Kitasatospora sp. NPDC088134]|uniref:ATP-binding protein n=1 Tax=Kitasatospora sp. NPDC088134 TaxID=3364071 RepID=UPI003808B3B5
MTDHPLGPDARHRRLDLRPGGPTAPAMAFVRAALADWQVDAALAADALLVAAELLANAIRHTPGAERLDLALEPGALRIAVTDASTDPPRPRPHRPDAPGGHGLFIVERLALTWGSDRAGHGKTVWVRVPIESR